MKRIMIACLSGLLVTGCMADKAPQPTPPDRDSPPPLIAGSAAPVAKLEITSAAGEIHIGQLHIGKSSPLLLAQCVSPSLPAADGGKRAEGAGMAGREAGDEAAASDRAGEGVVNEPEERTDAAPARPGLHLFPPK